jgi:tetratricopeptide (TPR) repeat protein
LYNYAALLRQLGRTAEARKYLDLAAAKAHELNDNILADDTDLVKAEMYTDSHEFDRATRLLDELEQRLRKRYAPEHFVFAEVASARSAIALARGDSPLAIDLAKEAVGLDEASMRRIGQCAAYLPTLLTRASQAELRGRQAAQAASDANRALEILQNEEGAGIPSSNIGRASLALAQALDAEGKQDEAQPAALRALANLQPTLGSDHPETRLARQLVDVRLPSH